MAGYPLGSWNFKTLRAVLRPTPWRLAISFTVIPLSESRRIAKTWELEAVEREDTGAFIGCLPYPPVDDPDTTAE